MKKILLLSVVLISVNLNSYAADIILPPSVGGMQNPEFQMRLLEQQRFRQEEYNEFKDMKQQKEEREREINLQNKFKQEASSQPVNSNKDVTVIKENGKLKLVPKTSE